jgi:hypothetical protein
LLVIKMVLVTVLIVPQFLAMAKRNEAKSSRRRGSWIINTEHLKKTKPFVLFIQRKIYRSAADLRAILRTCDIPKTLGKRFTTESPLTEVSTPQTPNPAAP